MMQLILLSTDLPDSQIEKYVEGKGIWFYAGVDFQRFKCIKKIIDPKFPYLGTPSEFNDFINSMRKEFVDWVESAHKIDGKDIDHWVSFFYAKNPYDENLFLLFCQYRWIVEAIKRKNFGKMIVIIENYFLLLDLSQLLKEFNVSFLFNSGTKSILKGVMLCKKKCLKALVKRNLFLRLCKRMIDYFNFVLKYLIFWNITNIIFKKNYGIKETLQETEVILDTYLYMDSVDRNGKMNDKHFPGLRELLERQFKKITIFPKFSKSDLSSKLQLIRKINQNPSEFIILEKTIRLADLIYAFLHPFRCAKKFRPPSGFNGLTVCSLIRSEWIKNLFSEISFFSLLRYRFAFRLKNLGIEPLVFLSWYENQLIDKGIAAGLKQFLPNTKVIGIQHVIPFKNYLSTFITESEVMFKVSPDVIVVPGKFFIPIMKEFQEILPVTTGLPSRYKYLERHFADFQSKGEKQMDKICLVLLPYSINLSISLLDEAYLGLMGLKSRQKKFLIKPHPDITIDFFIKQLRSRGLQFEKNDFTEKSLVDLFPETNVVISTGTGAILEALCLGILIIQVGSPISMNLFPVIPSGSEPLRKIAYGDKEIDGALRNWAEGHQFNLNSRLDIGKKTYDLCFGSDNGNLNLTFLK